MYIYNVHVFGRHISILQGLNDQFNDLFHGLSKEFPNQSLKFENDETKIRSFLVLLAEMCPIFFVYKNLL